MDKFSLRLSNVLSRVSVEVHEAVALVRAVADCLSAAPGQGVPELNGIELTSAGAVGLSGTALQGDPVKRLGQLLHAALLQADAPVQLRLRASEATGPTPVFSSAAEFSHALAYFERPNRELVLRSLYERVIAAPSAHVTASTLDGLVPLQRPPIEHPRRERKRSASQLRIDGRAIAGLGAVAAISFVLVAYSQFTGAGKDAGEGAGAGESASGGVASAMLGGISTLTEAAGLGRLVPTRGQTKDSLSPPLPSDVTTRIPDAPRGAGFNRRRNIAVMQLPPIQQLPPNLASTLALLPKGSSVGVPELRSSESLTTPRIYTESDAEVTAPVGIRPQFPTVLPGQNTRDLSQIEVVVRPDGSVASVKLLGESKTVLENMLLSAAKAWIFTPAVKDGQPVPFRKVVWLAMQ